VCQFFFDAAAFPPISWQFRVEGDGIAGPWENCKDINLFDLMPLFRLNRGDGASTSTTWRMSGVYRLMVKGPNRIGIQTMPQRDISVQLAR
jgi:vanillate/4-hydroxybenzoate decarboxylase subunit C